MTDSPTADSLLDDLRHSRTDLPYLVAKVRETRRDVVIVSAHAVDAWRSREPEAWRKVHDGLAAGGVSVQVV